jgi:hypothetical protein
MITKAIARMWAGAKLDEQVAHTQSLIRNLEEAKEGLIIRAESKKAELSQKIHTHRRSRDKDLADYVDFMNQQIEITGNYMQELQELQEKALYALVSWMNLDVCQKNIGLVKKSIHTNDSLKSLLESYISELSELIQMEERKMWDALLVGRDLKISSEFIQTTMRSIERGVKSKKHERSDVIHRLKSHRSHLFQSRMRLSELKGSLYESHDTLKREYGDAIDMFWQQYQICINRWNEIKTQFESYLCHTPTGCEYVDRRLDKMHEGGTLAEICGLIREEKEELREVYSEINEINEEYQPLRERIHEAHETNEYYDSFANDNAEKKRLRKILADALEKKRGLQLSISVLSNRRDELGQYVNGIRPFHPNAVMNFLQESLQEENDIDFSLALRNGNRTHESRY